MQNHSTLVLVHGLFGPLHYFDPAARMPGIRVLTPDLLGYGVREATPELSLAAQAADLVRMLRANGSGSFHLVGHSVGGAVAFLAAARAPRLVKGIVSVEGNFTLEDAFMCRRIAPLEPPDWAAELRRIQGDPSAWLQEAGIRPTPERQAMAHCILHNQSSTALQAMARAVINETSGPNYLHVVREVISSGIPLHLLAGSRSASSWNVPAWVRDAAASDVTLADCGHMMMLEEPELFSQSLIGMLY